MRSLLVGAMMCLLWSVPVLGQQAAVFLDGFETADTSAWWAPARVGETGQSTCFDGAGMQIACAGTGQDGDLRGGVAWPTPRFVDNGDGTVTDKLTALVWLKDASCSELAGADAYAKAPWTTAVAAANALSSGTCGLSDGSAPGDWRLPSRFELESVLDLEYQQPAVPNSAGTGRWAEGDPFVELYPNYYWTSTSRASDPDQAWFVNTYHGIVSSAAKTLEYCVWPVRAVR